MTATTDKTPADLTAAELSALLLRLNACPEARDWAEGKTLNQAWAEAERADWMLWLLARMKDEPGWQSHQTIVLSACDCAGTVKRFWPVRARKACATALRVARQWAKGKATLEQVRVAAAAAATTEAAFAATEAATAATAAAAGYAADAYAAAAGDAAAAGYAAAAADAAAAGGGGYAARQQAHKRMCALIRKRVPYPRGDRST